MIMMLAVGTPGSDRIWAMNEDVRTLARELWTQVELMQLADNDDAEMLAQAVYALVGDKRQRWTPEVIANWCECDPYPQLEGLLLRAAGALRGL